MSTVLSYSIRSKPPVSSAAARAAEVGTQFPFFSTHASKASAPTIGACLRPGPAPPARRTAAGSIDHPAEAAIKGVVFTEFLDFVAERYGADTVDDIIETSQLPSGGAYTAVGTYSHAEMVTLCTTLAAHTGEPVADLVRSFGSRLSGTFAQGYPAFFSRSGNFFDFLESIESHIHVEVRKLYPDAELPTFKIEERTPTRLVMEYRSPRRMGELAEGLILGTARQFGVEVRVQSTPIEGSNAEATRFVVDLL